MVLVSGSECRSVRGLQLLLRARRRRSTSGEWDSAGEQQKDLSEGGRR